MEKIIQSEFHTISYNPANQLLEQIWLPASQNMTEDEFKKSFGWDQALLKGGITKRILIDSRKLLFVVSPELQKWLVENPLIAAIQKGLEKMAFILPEDSLLAQVAVEQSIDENHEQTGMNNREFTNRYEAMKWLLDN